jgi:hypothetical protein
MRNDNPVITFWIEKNLDYRKPSIWNAWNIFTPLRSETFTVWWDNVNSLNDYALERSNGYVSVTGQEIAGGRWLSEAMERMERKMAPFLRNRYHVRSTRYAPSSSQRRIVETKIAVFRPFAPSPPPKGE